MSCGISVNRGCLFVFLCYFRTSKAPLVKRSEKLRRGSARTGALCLHPAKGQTLGTKTCARILRREVAGEELLWRLFMVNRVLIKFRCKYFIPQYDAYYSAILIAKGIRIICVWFGPRKMYTTCRNRSFNWWGKYAPNKWPLMHPFWKAGYILTMFGMFS